MAIRRCRCLWYLRDVAGLTGTKFGCGMSLCGACTVHQNGEAIRSCTTSMKEVGGSRDHDDRGDCAHASRAESVDGDSRSAMRILPDRTDHAGDRDAQGE